MKQHVRRHPEEAGEKAPPTRAEGGKKTAPPIRGEEICTTSEGVSSTTTPKEEGEEGATTSEEEGKKAAPPQREKSKKAAPPNKWEREKLAPPTSNNLTR